ncbi:MAG: hypothetical protein ACHQ49_08285 [Elusimicrobiota bacterium]
MNALSLLVVALAAAAPARAQASPAARIGALVDGGAGWNGAAIPPLSSFAAPSAAPMETQPMTPPASVVPPGLWRSLSAPDAATLARLSSRIPELKTDSVRVLTFDTADAMFTAAMAQGESPIDFFTDAAFRGSDTYYLAPETVAAIFARYEIHALTPASGTTKKGEPFVLEGMLIGAGRIDALYNLDQFEFDNPLLDGKRYKLLSRVIQRIQGPGDLKIEGVWTQVGFLHPQILRVVKTSPTMGRVETNYGSRVRPATPIRRR